MIMFNAQANEHQHGEMMNMQPAAPWREQLISATGVIEAVDMESKRLRSSMIPIPAVNWPAMTMRFTLVPIRRLMIY
jgi:Cu(I)/Ag(I) efflux system protein CusF